ncbi:MAG TPA: hypothetical protein VMU04_06610 [Candidatus Acidoferrum sp.]|nr:hypothetical protein [Candidatus Acidoferrum sp.]
MEHSSPPQLGGSALAYLRCRAARDGWKALALVPFGYLIYVVVKYAVAVPAVDQWELVPVLDKMFSGQLSGLFALRQAPRSPKLAG